MKKLVLLLLPLAACSARDSQSATKVDGPCPADTRAVVENARALFATNRPEASPADFEVRTTVVDDRVVIRFVPRGERTVGDSPAVVYNCVTQDARFLGGE